MKIKFIVISYFFTFCAFSQKQYLIQYDRINDEEKYFELTYSKGSFTETPIKKPNLKKGDLVKFRAVNMNPMVFNLDVKSENAKIDNNSVGSKVLSGFKDIFGEMDGAFRAVSNGMSNVSSYQAPQSPTFSRGATKKDEARQLSLSALAEFHTSLKKTYGMLAQYNKAIANVYSTELTKDQICNQLKVAVASFNKSDYNNELRKLNSQYAFLVKDTLIFKNERYELDSLFSSLNKEIENTLASPNKANDLLELVESSVFSSESTVIIGYEDRYGSERLDDLDEDGLMNYTIHFRSHKEADKNYEFDNVLQDHNVSLSVKSPSNFSWSSGLIIVSPFKGFNSYAVEELGNDSLKIISGSSVASTRFTLATNLMYNFPTNGQLIPQAMFGVSMGFLSSDINKPVNFLLGAGLKFKKFPLISISSGVSMCQNTRLKNGFELGKTYVKSFSVESIDSIVEKSFSPGYFIGININL
jgi:hypothetical protein